MSDVRGDKRRAAALDLIRTAMIEKKLTQAELADAADCHEKTVQNLLHGRPVRDQTLFDVCMVLGLDFEDIRARLQGGSDRVSRPATAEDGRPGGTVGEVAPVHMGAYTRAAVEDYIGDYVTLRPFFDGSGRVACYRTLIRWDETRPCLAFEEHERHDKPFSHRGTLYIPATSSFIHFVSLTKGAMRAVLVSQLDTSRTMRGIITTLTKKAGAMFMPVSAPILYQRVEAFGPPPYGMLEPGKPAYDACRALLRETLDQSYAALIQP